jgi:hypothetical protein
MTVAARAVFTDGDSWSHLLITGLALALLAAYLVAGVAPPLPTVRRRRASG